MLLFARMATDDTVQKPFPSIPHHFDDRSSDDRAHISQPRAAARSPIRFDLDFSAGLAFPHQPQMQVQQNYALSPASPFSNQFQYPPSYRSSYDFGFVGDHSKISPPMTSQYMAADPLTYLTPLSIPDTRFSSEPASTHGHGNSQSPDISSPTSADPVSPGSALPSGPSNQSSSDQPPTTQGRVRSRVYVACLQCRSRKIRCDGAKPTCHNCTRRSSECKYDAVPKRRGPDKKPGARQRTVKKKDSDPTVPDPKMAAAKKKRRKSEDSESASPSDMGLAGPSSPLRAGPILDLNLNPTRPLYITPPIPPLAEMDQRQSLAVPVPQPLLHGMSANYVYSSFERQDSFERQSNRAFLQSVGDDNEQSRHELHDHTYRPIAAEPSLDFSRKTWWDNLLNVYSHTREASFEQITTDLKYLFRASNYWLSFFNVPLFFKIFLSADTRDRMQPSVVLAALALSTFMQSNDIDRGEPGRNRALGLRDAAQSALEASFNAQWIEPTLAQAAWLLALFEVCAHPDHSTERATSAMIMLDSIIRALALTTVDAEDPSASVFSPRAVPTVPAQGHLPGSSFRAKHCACEALSLGQNWPLATTFTPLWMYTPAWDPNWSDAEIRKEESRRLCWSSLNLAASHTAHAAAFSQPPLDFYLIQPSNYAILFPGEALLKSAHFDRTHYAKESIWALHARSMLLWNSCLRMRGDSVNESEKAQFAVQAWLESTAIEDALDAHTCGAERAFLFQGREFLFNTRMCISYEFRRYIPHADTEVSGLFHRKKAEEWLSHQAAVAKRIMQGLHTVTGQQDNLLARRPYFVWWFMSQVARALLLWTCDNSLTLALEVSQAFLPPIDYLSSLWPCASQRRKYKILFNRLTQACLVAGLPIPPTPNLKSFSPSSPPTLV